MHMTSKAEQVIWVNNVQVVFMQPKLFDPYNRMTTNSLVGDAIYLENIGSYY